MLKERIWGATRTSALWGWRMLQASFHFTAVCHTTDKWVCVCVCVCVCLAAKKHVWQVHSFSHPSVFEHFLLCVLNSPGLYFTDYVTDLAQKSVFLFSIKNSFDIWFQSRTFSCMSRCIIQDFGQGQTDEKCSDVVVFFFFLQWRDDLIPASRYYLRWTMLERHAAPSRHQLLLYRREQLLTWGQRTAWSPTAMGLSASTVMGIIKTTGGWWSRLMSYERIRQYSMKKHTSLSMRTPITDALCNFGEEIVIRRERYSLTDFFFVVD